MSHSLCVEGRLRSSVLVLRTFMSQAISPAKGPKGGFILFAFIMTAGCSASKGNSLKQIRVRTKNGHPAIRSHCDCLAESLCVYVRGPLVCVGESPVCVWRVP